MPFVLIWMENLYLMAVNRDQGMANIDSNML